MPQTVIGCDLARGWIDSHALPSGTSSRIENTPAEISIWTEDLRPESLIAFEATFSSQPCPREASAS